MCGPAGACDPRDFDETPPAPIFIVTPKHAARAAMDVLKVIMDMNPEEMLTQLWIAKRSDNTIEHLRACAAAAAQGYSVCPGHNGRFYCATDEADNCRDTCEYCGAPKGMIFRGCEKCKECIENNWNKPEENLEP